MVKNLSLKMSPGSDGLKASSTTFSRDRQLPYMSASPGIGDWTLPDSATNPRWENQNKSMFQGPVFIYEHRCEKPN